MLLTDWPIRTAVQAWEIVEEYARRWGSEEGHRAFKSVCKVELRELKTARHLERVLAFDLILAWRILALLKLGRVLPQVLASLIYTPEEIEVLTLSQKKPPRWRSLTRFTLEFATSKSSIAIASPQSSW
jgi:hypothetical protein